MSTAVTIGRRFCGPPGSGNGGYTCGLAAEPFGPGAVEVTLRVPPPLDRRLDLSVDGDEAALTDGEAVIATERPATTHIPAGPIVAAADAQTAVGRLDEAGYHAAHPFAGCFTCGPVPTEFLWAALDCPGGQAWISTDTVGAAVLGRLAVRIERDAVPGEELVVTGWQAGRDGRRLGSGSSLRTPAGDLVAAAAATWIELTPEQVAAFGVAT